MKKSTLLYITIPLVLFVLILLLCVFYCGRNTDEKYCGRYDIVAIESEHRGIGYTPIENLEYAGIYTISGFYIELREDGTATCFRQTDDVVDWYVRGNKIKIDRFNGWIEDDGIICIEYANYVLYFANSEKTAKSNKKVNSIEELNELVSKDVTDTITALQTEFEKISANIDTFDKYKANIERVNGVYAKVINDTELLCIRLREYSSEYLELILSSDKSIDDKHKDFDALYKSINKGALKEIYDVVYEGVLIDMYNFFYNGVLSYANDNIPYDEWHNMSSNEYATWLDTSSKVYDVCLDAQTDIYDFFLDISGELLSKNIEKAEQKLQDFKDDIEILYKKASE